MPLPPDRDCINTYDFKEPCISQWQEWSGFCNWDGEFDERLCDRVYREQEKAGIEWATPTRPDLSCMVAPLSDSMT